MKPEVVVIASETTPLKALLKEKEASQDKCHREGGLHDVHFQPGILSLAFEKHFLPVLEPVAISSMA